MYACVKVISPIGGTPPFFEDFTGVNDAKTGTPFAITAAFLMGGYCPPNALTYYGTFDDSSFHWDLGFYHTTQQGSQGGGTCADFALKICSGADGYGYALMDTFPDIFFGGYIGGFGYINNVVPGGFRVNWDRRDRAGDAKIMLCVGLDSDPNVGIEINGNAVNGTYGFAKKPQGFITWPTVFGSPGSGPAVTGAGGTGWGLGWNSIDNNRGHLVDSAGSQGNNSCQQWTDRFEPGGAFISAWNPLSYTISSGTGARYPQAVLTGINGRTASGSFRIPPTDGLYSFTNTINAVFMMFATVGLAPGTFDNVNSSGCIGIADGVNQASYWTGESTQGNNPLKGARFLSTSKVLRNGLANNAATTQKNIGNVVSISETGTVVMNFTNTDGTSPEVIWTAWGTARIPQTNSGIHFINPDKPQKHDSYNNALEVKIPDPTIRTADIGS